MRSPGASSAGACRVRHGRTSSWMRSSRRFMTGVPCTKAVSSTTAIAACNMSRSAIPNGVRMPASSPRSAASATAMTMRSPKPSTACSRPRSSIGAAPGEAWRPWSSPPSNGSTGSTTVVSSSRSATSRLPRRKPPTTLSLRQSRWPRRTQTNLPPAIPARFRSFMFNSRGVGHKFDPFEGKTTDSDLRSAATILLHRPHEGQNAVFTERAITMLTQIFHAAKLENQRPLPFAYKILNEGLYGTATILEIISDKHKFYPHLATKVLDISYEQADFDSKFLQDCYSTMTARINNILTKETVRCFTGSDFTGKNIITSGDHAVSLYLLARAGSVDPRPPYRARLGLPDQRHGRYLRRPKGAGLHAHPSCS